MSACLCVNDDLHKTFKRWNDIKDGKKPAGFVPGETTQETCLEPTHVYSQSGEGAKVEEDEYYDEEEPEPVAVRKERKATIAHKAAQEVKKMAAPDFDLLDFSSVPTKPMQ
jgi:hypothetical protein